MLDRSLDEILDRFLARCRVDADTGCATWTGAFSQGVCKAQMSDNQGRRVVNVRRVILEAKNGRPLGNRLASCRCGNERCIAPDHLVALTRDQVQKRSSKLGLFDQPHVQAARIAAGRKRATISMDVVRSIRSAAAAGEPQRTIADRVGLTQATVWKIVHHMIAAESANGASVFAWRPAA